MFAPVIVWLYYSLFTGSLGLGAIEEAAGAGRQRARKGEDETPV